VTPEEREVLFKAMQRCAFTPKQLAILYMVAWGWTHKEVAELLRLDRSTVSRHWRDAVARMRVFCP